MISIFQKYIEKRKELVKLESVDKVSKIGSQTIFFGVLAFIAVHLFLFLFLGLGLYIGSLLGNFGYGVLVIAGFFLLLVLILIVFRKTIVRGLRNLMINNMLN